MSKLIYKEKYIPIVQIYVTWWRGAGWFRFNNGVGYGLYWKNSKKHPLLFSERMGIRKAFTFFNIQFKILKSTK